MKKICVLILSGLLVFTGCGTNYKAELKEAYRNGGYDAAINYYDRVKDSVDYDEAYELLDTISELEFGIALSNDDFDSIGETVSYETDYYEDYTSKLEVTDKEITDGKLFLTVKNTGDKTVSYFKYDIFFYDADGNNIDSDWGNSSKTLKPDAQCTEDTYVDVPDDAEKYSVEIVDVTIE
ncbi:MAG: hypothetical protein J6D39_14420 [Niameybacter sp.]|nr:hypothetical protein [Niameybacter sp.]